MSSTVVVEKPRFMPGEWIDKFMRRARPRAEDPAPVEPNDVPPFAPTSAFVTADDEVIECET